MALKIQNDREKGNFVGFPQEILTELLIPCQTVSGSRKAPVVLYSIEKAIRSYTANRPGLLAKCTAIDGDMSKKLLDHGYKQLSRFKRWCPVEVGLFTCEYL